MNYEWSHGIPWDPMGSQGIPWDPMGPVGPMRTHGTDGTHGTHGSHGIPWDPMGLMGSHGIKWDPMGSHGTPWDAATRRDPPARTTTTRTTRTTRTTTRMETRWPPIAHARRDEISRSGTPLTLIHLVFCFERILIAFCCFCRLFNWFSFLKEALKKQQKQDKLTEKLTKTNEN